MSNKKIIYGFHAILSRLYRFPNSVEVIFFDPTRRDRRMRDFLDIANTSNIEMIIENSKQLYNRSGTQKHQGVVAYVTDISVIKTLSELLNSLDSPPFLLVLDGITDPHNLGACLRVADAAGVHALIAPRDRAVKCNGTVAKVASGAADTVPYITVTNLARSLREIKEFGIYVIGTDNQAPKNIYETNLNIPIALIMGGEGKGMRRLIREACDTLVRIPMSGTIENLNVSVASGICLFEAMRQRLALGKF